MAKINEWMNEGIKVLETWKKKTTFFSELLGDILVEKPRETTGTDRIIVVDNVPTISPDRLEKLKNVIRKVFSKFGKIVTEHYPQDENGQTKG